MVPIFIWPLSLAPHHFCEDSTADLDDEFLDMHWTPAMHDAASKLLDSRQKARIASFETNLSGNAYYAILKESPHLKPTLLETLRKGVLDADRDISSDVYKSAAQIFLKESPEKMLELYNALPSGEKSNDLLQLFVKHFATQESPEIRAKGLQVIEQGFRGAQSRVFDEIMDTFPGFDEACDWLEDKVDEGKISKKEPASQFGPEARKRDTFIEKFEKIAVGRDEYGESGYWDDADVGVDSDDSDYKEEMEARHPDLTRPFLIWVTELCQWPQKEEAQKLWDGLKSSDDGGDLFFTVDGVADSLASRQAI